MTEKNYDHLPLMQRPGFINTDRKHVYAKLIQVGDVICESGRSAVDKKWTVEKVEVGNFLVYLTYTGGRKHAIGTANERVWVQRVAPGAVPVPFPED